MSLSYWFLSSKLFRGDVKRALWSFYENTFSVLIFTASMRSWCKHRHVYFFSTRESTSCSQGENNFRGTLFEARKVAGSAAYKQSQSSTKLRCPLRSVGLFSHEIKEGYSALHFHKSGNLQEPVKKLFTPSIQCTALFESLDSLSKDIPDDITMTSSELLNVKKVSRVMEDIMQLWWVLTMSKLTFMCKVSEGSKTFCWRRPAQ